MSDIEAVVAAKLSTWKLAHLGLWVDLIEPPSTPVKPCSTMELMEMEDLAAAAKFREMKAKIAQDVSDMVIYNAQQAETERRSHVVMVMHEKGQTQIGKTFLGSNLSIILYHPTTVSFMENRFTRFFCCSPHLHG